jgi:uncharacterized protein YciI
LESVATYAVTISYDDLALRDKIGPMHREYLASLFKRKVLVEAGPYGYDSGALLIYEADSQQALQAVLDEDPYVVNTGCLASLTIKEWKRVYPGS